MSAPLPFAKRLLVVLLPTTGQIIGSLCLALLIVCLAQSRSLVAHIGLPAYATATTGAQITARFDAILTSPITSQAALVTFWALIGLVIYLICWGAYNALIEARNEVTLTTSYTNRGHWRSSYHTLALKSVSAVGLALIIWSLWQGIAFWLALSAEVITHPSLLSSAQALAGVMGLALQLYLVLMFVQLTFSPWYRAETFTDS